MNAPSRARERARTGSENVRADGDPTKHPDVVDQIIEEMEPILPGADLSSLHLVSRMLRIIRVFERRRDQVLKFGELDGWSFDMLAAIRRSPAQQLRPGDLMEVALVTSGTMTTRLDSLERRKLIERRRDPNDRRGVLVVLTESGRRQIDAAFAEVLQCQRGLVAGLDAGDRQDLEVILRRILAHIEGNPVR